MKFCTHCGNQLLDESVMCPKCGFPTEEGAIAPVPMVAPMPLPVPAHQPAQSVKKKPTFSPLSIVGFIFAFIVPLVGLVCSVLAFINARYDENKRCKSFAKSGIIISAIFFAVHTAFYIADYILRAKGLPGCNYWEFWWHLFF